MHVYYGDIYAAVGFNVQPTWFNEFAVPRFCAFDPDNSADIYADEVVLCKIRCQSCGRAFLAAMSSDSAWCGATGDLTVLERVVKQTLHYGDPPNVLCCMAGPTMNSVMDRVVEAWRKNRKSWEWERSPEHEVDFDVDAGGEKGWCD